MKVNLQKLQQDYVQREAGSAIDPEKLNQHISSLYGKKPKYSAAGEYDLSEIQDQVNILCTKMEGLGLEKFGKLRDKFAVKPKGADISMLNMIKETMEAVVYQAESGTLSAEDLGAQFGDRDFLCRDGTLTNLQSILSEMTLGKQDVSAFITEAKDEMVTQIITEMYREGKFSEYPYVFRMYKPMEIHNITSLKNSIADQYGLITKTKNEDKYLKDISNSSKKKIQSTLEERMSSPEMMDTLIDRVAMNVVMNLPYYEEGMNKNTFANDLVEKLDQLGIRGGLAPSTFIRYEEYAVDGVKENIQDIIRDTVIVNLHESGVIQSPEIDKVKVRLSLESSMDMMFEANAIGEEAIQEAEEKGLKSYAFEYAIERGLSLDPDDFAPSDPAEYCIENGIKLKGKDPREFVLDNIIGEYLKTSDLEKKEQLEQKYKRIQNLGRENEVELLGVDSAIGQMLAREDAPKLLAELKQVKGEDVVSQVDHKKCSLKLIEQMFSVTENSSKEQVRNYDKLSTKQNVAMAFSAVIPPVAIASYFLMKKRNQSKKVALEKKLNVPIDKISEDLKRISVSSEKEVPVKSASKEIAGKAGIRNKVREIIKRLKHHKTKTVSSKTSKQSNVNKGFSR